MIEFSVEGTPVPQGSMKVIHGRILHSQGSALINWRNQIGFAARQALTPKLQNAVTMDLVFFMPKPKTVKRTFPSVAPDLDKLIRAVLDALTGIAYEDDGQVCSIHAHKIYGERAGILIRVGEKTEK